MDSILLERMYWSRSLNDTDWRIHLKYIHKIVIESKIKILYSKSEYKQDACDAIYIIAKFVKMGLNINIAKLYIYNIIYIINEDNEQDTQFYKIITELTNVCDIIFSRAF